MDRSLFMVVWLVRRSVILLILGSADPCGLDIEAAAMRRGRATTLTTDPLDLVHFENILALLGFVFSGPLPGDAILYYDLPLHLCGSVSVDPVKGYRARG